MNENEMKMIEEMEQVLQDEQIRIANSVDGFKQLMKNGVCNCHATALYNAGYRKIADDEILIKKSELARLKNLEINYEQVYEEYRKLEQERKSCRLIADDEIIIKKSEYVVIPKQDWEDRAYIHAMENHLYQKCRDMIGEKFVAKEEVEYWKSRCKEIGDVASKETAREIFAKAQKKAYFKDGGYYDKDRHLLDMKDLQEILKKYGIELE